MPINVTDKAMVELKKLDVPEGQFLRISVIPGGCAGMTYSAAITDEKGDDDEVLFEGEVTIISEAGNDLFLDGLEIDFSDDLIRSGFRFKNVNLSGSCGCGASFAG